MAELVDALDLGSSTVRCEGSSPFIRILNSASYFKMGGFKTRHLPLNFFAFRGKPIRIDT